MKGNLFRPIVGLLAVLFLFGCCSPIDRESEKENGIIYLDYHEQVILYPESNFIIQTKSEYRRTELPNPTEEQESSYPDQNIDENEERDVSENIHLL